MIRYEGDEGSITTDPSKAIQKRKTKCAKFKTFLYNREDETVCRRTLTGWCKICSYYIIFIIAAFGLFFAFIYSYKVRDINLDPAYDKSKLYIGASPSLTMFPSIEKNRATSVIWYTTKPKQQSDNTPEKYSRKITKFLIEQDNKCHNASKHDTSCLFNRTDFGPCNVYDYGYKNKSPCVFLKLNKLPKWVPLRFADSIPKSVPDELRSIINPERSALWVNCAGTNEFNKQHIGSLTYYPEQAYHENHFPTSFGAPNPLVAVHLSQIESNYVLEIQCTLYAQNIKNDRNSKVNVILNIED